MSCAEQPFLSLGWLLDDLTREAGTLPYHWLKK